MSDELYLAVVRRRIQRARLAKNLRQEDVAERLGISVRSYQRYESEAREKTFNPYAATLRRLALAIGEDIGHIMREPTDREFDELRAQPRRSRVRRGKG
ncbi:MAG: helix-turn-helix transcriptional regulator [Trueperaceae bacterium]